MREEEEEEESTHVWGVNERETNFAFFFLGLNPSRKQCLGRSEGSLHEFTSPGYSWPNRESRDGRQYVGIGFFDDKLIPRPRNPAKSLRAASGEGT